MAKKFKGEGKCRKTTGGLVIRTPIAFWPNLLNAKIKDYKLPYDILFCLNQFVAENHV